MALCLFPKLGVTKFEQFNDEKIVFFLNRAKGKIKTRLTKLTVIHMSKSKP